MPKPTLQIPDLSRADLTLFALERKRCSRGNQSQYARMQIIRRSVGVSEALHTGWRQQVIAYMLQMCCQRFSQAVRIPRRKRINDLAVLNVIGVFHLLA